MDDGQFVLISSSSCHEVHLTALIGGKFLLENLDQVLELSGEVIETILTAEPRGCCERWRWRWSAVADPEGKNKISE